MSSDLGMVGLGVMGCNLLLNMADHGFSVVGYDRDRSKVEALNQKKSEKGAIQAVDNIPAFLSALRTPRVIMMLVPAGAPVDSVVRDLLPHLQTGDILIDGGNSYFKDTELRSKNLKEKGIHFFGVGISGGEEGARLGPSIMPGGVKEVYERFRPIFEACAAKVNGEPCVTYIGPKSAGHYVKMVHNGIEYGIMQLISETYDIMKRCLGLTDDKLHLIYKAWNDTELNSYLLEITTNIFRTIDDRTGKHLIDQIRAVAQQKGTGMWTSQSAMELQTPIPTIDQAVITRDLSLLYQQREQASKLLPRPIQHYSGDATAFIEQLRQALYAGMITTYAQGMALMHVASQKMEYNLDLGAIARIWRGGCIIRAALLEDIYNAFRKDSQLPNLLLDATFAKKIMQNDDALRKVVSTALGSGVPIPCLMASLSYIDGYRSSWLPMNLIQAQRDYFGSHTYERKDDKGTYHTNWEQTVLYG